MKTTYCDKCFKRYKNCNFKKHRCDKNEVRFKIKEDWNIGNNRYKCPECDSIFSKFGLISHYYRKHDERGIKFLKERLEKSKNKKTLKKKLTKDEINKKISITLKKCHSEGRHPGWSHINLDKNRRSYPEKFFIDVFKNNFLYEKHEIKEKYPFGKYFLDFLFVDIGLVIEIDGSQHYRTFESIEHDKKRDEYLNLNGLKVYRIKWTDVCVNSDSEINEMLRFIDNIDNETDRKYDIKDFKGENICECGNTIKTKKSKICNICRYMNNRIVKDRPNYDVLIKDIN